MIEFDLVPKIKNNRLQGSIEEDGEASESVLFLL